MKVPDFIVLETVRVDVRHQRVLRAGSTDKLTSRETQLLVYLSNHAHRTIPREELLVEVWSFSPTSMTRAVDNMVRKLRSKLERDPKNPVHIHTVHGEGYRFEPHLVESTDLATSMPAESARVGVDHNLDTIRTVLVGRESELSLVLRAIQEKRPLVTLVGPSGMGKTTLAHVAGKRLLEEGLIGSAWFVPGMDITSPQGWLDAVARTLHLEGLGTSSLEQIGRALANRGRVLMILDNVEHVSDLVAEGLEVLREAAPNAQFLVTSQHKLGLRGEKIVRLQKLSLEESKEVFTTRMEDMGYLEEVDQTDPKILDTLMRYLDGIPLSIELAVAGVQVLSIEQLTVRYGEHLDLLRSIDAMKNLRHHSLRGAVSWSWSLLSPDERRVTAYCSLFCGGFSVDAVQSLMNHSVMPLGVPSLLRRLTDKSMMFSRMSPPPTRERQMVLFQAVKTYGLEQLQTLGEWRRAQLAFVKHMASLCSRSYVEMNESLLDREWENIVQAFTFAQKYAPEYLASLAIGLARLSRLWGDQSVAITHLVEALETDPEGPLKNDLKVIRAHLVAQLGQWEQSAIWLKEVREDIQSLPLMPLHVHVCIEEAEHLRKQSKLREGLDQMEALSGISRHVLPIMVHARLDIARINMTLHLGQPQAALEMILKVKEGRTFEGSTETLILKAESVARISLGQLSQAQASLAQLGQRISSKGIHRAILLADQAWCAAELGDHLDSIPLAKQAVQEAKETGQKSMEAFMLSRLAHCWLAAGDHDALEKTCEEVIRIYDAVGDPVRRGLARTNKAIAMRMKGQPRRAQDELTLALEEFGSTATRYAAYARMHLSLVLPKEEMERRITLYRAAEEVLTQGGSEADRHLAEIAWAHHTLDGYVGEEQRDVTEVLAKAKRYVVRRQGADLRVAIQMLECHLNA